MKITVVIPCGPRHTQFLPRIVKNLIEGTVVPDEIIIAVSEITDEQGFSLQKSLTEVFANIRILPTQLKCGPGVNRNRGAAVVAGDVISFIDADDIIHPQKIEIVKYVFEKYKPSIFLHSMILGLDGDFPVYENLQELENTVQVVKGDEIYKNTFGTGNRYYRPASNIWADNTAGGSLHHGHSSVLASVVKGIDAIEFGNYVPGEDGNFCRDVLFKHRSMIFWALPLLKYQSSGSWWGM